MTRVKFEDKDDTKSYHVRETTSESLSISKKDMLKERYEMFMARMEDTDEDANDIFVVEIPTAKQNRDDVIEAKGKELENLKKYDVFETVEDTGQTTIGARWVVTKKESHDGQKCRVKARLVARGFQETEYVQKDTPTAQKESFKLFLLWPQ